jgi:hypothetical protein
VRLSETLGPFNVPKQRRSVMDLPSERDSRSGPWPRLFQPQGTDYPCGHILHASRFQPSIQTTAHSWWPLDLREIHTPSAWGLCPLLPHSPPRVLISHLRAWQGGRPGCEWPLCLCRPCLAHSHLAIGVPVLLWLSPSLNSRWMGPTWAAFVTQALHTAGAQQSTIWKSGPHSPN